MKTRTTIGITLLPVALFISAIAVIAAAAPQAKPKTPEHPLNMPLISTVGIPDSAIIRSLDYEPATLSTPLLSIAPAKRIDIRDTTPDSTVICYKDQCRRLAELFPTTTLRSWGTLNDNLIIK